MAKSRKRTDAPVSAANSSVPGEQTSGNGSTMYDRDRVAQRAYELYLARGGSHGSDWDDWLAAERELINAGNEQGRSERERHR